MGLCSASEYFHGELRSMLKHIPGVVVHIDDVAVFGRTLEEHDERLNQVLQVLSKNGVTLNNKCQFRVTRMLWVGNIVSGKGLEPDSSKVRAIEEMEPPKDKAAVKSLQARTQFLREYVPHMADVMVPITDLLRDRNAFVYGMCLRRRLLKS